jgi:hypothetical protein
MGCCIARLAAHFVEHIASINGARRSSTQARGWSSGAEHPPWQGRRARLGEEEQGLAAMDGEGAAAWRHGHGPRRGRPKELLRDQGGKQGRGNAVQGAVTAGQRWSSVRNRGGSATARAGKGRLRASGRGGWSREEYGVQGARRHGEGEEIPAAGAHGRRGWRGDEAESAMKYEIVLPAADAVDGAWCGRGAGPRAEEAGVEGVEEVSGCSLEASARWALRVAVGESKGEGGRQEGREPNSVRWGRRPPVPAARQEKQGGCRAMAGLAPCALPAARGGRSQGR